MNLKIFLPTHTFLDQKVTKVTAEAENGFFCILPRHIDFVAALVPGILFFETGDGKEEFFAVNEGILVKVGQEVLVSVRNAVRGPGLGSLKQAVEKEFRLLDDREQAARSAAAKLEANVVRKFTEFQDHGR